MTSKTRPAAQHMRRVVLPGMAELLNRPVYDRAKTYEYNKKNAAFGCYHCHQLNQPEKASQKASEEGRRRALKRPVFRS